MARRRSTIAKKVTFDINEMAAHVYGMSDEELGKWMHKAIKDCIEGCVDPATDCFVKRMYEESYGKMQQKQIIDANTYRNRLARQKNSGKPNHDKTNDPALTTPTAGGSCGTFSTTPCANTVSTNPSQEAPTRKAGDELTESGNGLLRNPLPSCEEHLDEARLSHQESASGSTVRGLAKVAQPGADSPASLFPEDTAKKLYGRFRHVRLSDEDGRELREEFGPRLKDAIEMLDNYIESLPSKKAGEKKCGVKYWQEDYERKNHKLCMLRWVKRAMDENETVSFNKKAAEARLKKAESTPKSFQQMERDRTSRVLRGESADGKNIVRDEDLTPEELEAKYA